MYHSELFQRVVTVVSSHHQSEIPPELVKILPLANTEMLSEECPEPN